MHAGRLPSRSERKQGTRAELLEAAATVFKRRGFHDASVAEIAAMAGYTVGAVYSNFGGKQDVLLALVERESRRITVEIAGAAFGTDDAREKLRRGTAAWMAFLDREPDLYAVFMEFWAVAARDPELKARNSALWGAARDTLGELVAQHAANTGQVPALPAPQVGAAIMALADGLAMQRLEEPESVPEGLFASLLDALLPALMHEA